MYHKWRFLSQLGIKGNRYGVIESGKSITRRIFENCRRSELRYIMHGPVVTKGFVAKTIYRTTLLAGYTLVQTTEV